MRFMSMFYGVVFFALLFTLSSCEDDNNSAGLDGELRMEITDAPIDDANVKGTFVTISSIEVDGQKVEGFSKQTIDLMAYQNGATKVLATADLEAGTYNDIRLILDYETDAAGNAPGCYVLTTDNVKHELKASQSTTSAIQLMTPSFTIEDEVEETAVIDFDLRKAIQYEGSSSSSDQFTFVTDSELQSSIRVVAKEETGMVMGNVSDNLNLAETIVVYAYEKGTFNKQTEVSGQGASQIQFKNAVSSGVADANGDFTLAFLEEGDYELHFFTYDDEDGDGRSELQGELELELLGSLGLDLNSISLDANANLSLNISIIGLIN